MDDETKKKVLDDIKWVREELYQALEGGNLGRSIDDSISRLRTAQKRYWGS